MYEDKHTVSIKFTNWDDTTLITVGKDGGIMEIQVIGKYSVSFQSHPSDLQRIVDMLNYVIKLNQDANNIPG